VGSLTSLALSRDGRVVVTVGARGAQLWDVARNPDGVQLTSRASLKLSDFIRGAAFSPDGKRLALVGDKVSLWEVGTAKELLSFPVRGHFGSLALSPDLSTLAVPDFQDVDLFDLASGKVRASLLDHRGAVEQVAFSDDGHWLAVASSRSDARQNYFVNLKLWKTGSNKEQAALPELLGFARFVGLSPEGRILLLLARRDLSGGPTDLKLLDIPSGRWTDMVTFQGKEDGPQSLVYSPMSHLIAAGMSNGTIRLWNIVPAK
jgi:WD40 repeat protein